MYRNTWDYTDVQRGGKTKDEATEEGSQSLSIVPQFKQNWYTKEKSKL